MTTTTLLRRSPYPPTGRLSFFEWIKAILALSIAVVWIGLWIIPWMAVLVWRNLRSRK